jgi:hypothetical protein
VGYGSVQLDAANEAILSKSFSERTKELQKDV